jgi:hypothetical protein
MLHILGNDAVWIKECLLSKGKRYLVLCLVFTVFLIVPLKLPAASCRESSILNVEILILFAR